MARTTTPTIDHPGMARSWFDTAVHRSFLVDLHVRPAAEHGVYLMDSTSRPGLTYRVTAERCGCEGDKRFGRCLHRARAAFENWAGQAPAAIDRMPETAA